MRTSALLLIVIFSLALAGCGYKLGEIRPTPMRGVRTLAVPTFKNKTYLTRVEVLCADTLIKRLQQDGTYRIVPDGEADAILNCTLTKAERRSIRSVQNNVLATSEFGFRMDVQYQIVDRVTGAILMQGGASGETTFFSGNDLQTIGRQALSIAAEDLASDIANEVCEGF